MNERERAEIREMLKDARPPNVLRREVGMDPESFAALVKRTRLWLGLSQSGLARRIGVHQSVVNRWESGKHWLTEGTLQTLAAALNCELELKFTPKKPAA